MRAEALLDALAVLAPTTCCGCDAPDRALCPTCTAALTPSPRERLIEAEPPLRVWAALDYGGPPRRVLLAFKDGGRTDAARALARPLRASVRSALAAVRPATSGEGFVRLATIPSTRAAYRRRGYQPVELVLARAGLRAEHPLHIARQTEDQAGLGLAERASNRGGSLRARPTAAGIDWLLVDDIVTTGSTLLEARRAIVAAGGTVLGAAVIAHTPLRRVQSG